MGVGGQRHAPAALLRAMTRYLRYMRLCGPQGWSGRVENLAPSHSPRFDPQTAACREVFLKRRAAARYRTLASIIPGREMFSRNLSF